MNDPIVEEVRRVRDAHAARFNYDLDAIFHDIKEQEKKSGHAFIAGIARKTASKLQDSRHLHDLKTREAAPTAEPSR